MVPYVSRKGKGFDPSVIHPVVGDVIAFEFRSGAHSAVRKLPLPVGTRTSSIDTSQNLTLTILAFGMVALTLVSSL